MLALIVGTLLAVAGLAYVLWPLIRGATIVQAERAPELPPESSAIDALREIEFDQATGKLSPEDYALLKAEYTPRALLELRAREAGQAVAGVSTDAADAAEAMIARARQRGTSCPAHGARPEPDALFCSECGRFLGTACISCGAGVSSETARFCVECGATLAA